MEIKTDLVLIRGLPGSGKTTYGEKHFKEYVQCEADQYHMFYGEYIYRPEMVKRAHELCLFRTENELTAGKKVVVSNTFITHWEMSKYLELAERLNKKVTVLRMCTQFESIHNVPPDKIEVMKQRFQDFPGEVLIK